MTTPGQTHAPILASPALVVVAGWVVPGAGYWLLGQRGRGLIICITVLALFLFGILFAGIRVIDVPGYDRVGNKVRLDPAGRRLESISNDRSYRTGVWALTGRGLFGEVAYKPWYVLQILNGPICLLASYTSLGAARGGVPISHGRIYDIGTLYTAVAGILNLLAVIDAAHRAAAHQDAQREAA